MLSENLARIRKEKGLTQEALAVKLNVVRQTVSKWEKGIAVPDADTLCAIADALDVSAAQLLGQPEKTEKTDMASIVEVLAQMNEQLAVRNRRTANIWKFLFLASLVVIGILIGKGSAMEEEKTVLPEVIQVSGVNLTHDTQTLSCSFVPAIENAEYEYSLTMHPRGMEDGSVTVNAECQNGVCKAVFDEKRLFSVYEYDMVLQMKYREQIRNTTIAEAVSFRDNMISWRPME
ncbi:MAG: helix-turn-helix domain-containing protein [Bulleidia sp.]|nr:helix-turn-helix domain-containing protein [Bulleidia sp.]HAW12542.1 hypothetical protein [Erysipelotrichaceae bacterium]